ncbi:MAG TPA: extracellular solute-binding protein [Firmicutes bacterium]|nr:extracellular solute-binding protein [Bacillota bacterium]
MKNRLVLLLALVMSLSLFVSSVALGSSDFSSDLVLYSSMTDNDLNNLVSLFNKKYPNIRIEIVNGSAGELTARIRAEKNNPQGDVMWGGLSNSDGAMYDDLFEHYLSPYEDEIYPAYRSNNGFYNLDHLSTIVFCVNTDLEKELGMNITSYKDLLDPRLKGKIVMPDPNSSSSAWNHVCNIFAVFGNDTKEAWDFMEGLLRNDVVISTSSSVAFKSVHSGEYVVGLSYEDGASTLLKSGATNIKIVYPEEGASASAFGVAVIKGAKNAEAAKLMVDYLMSPEGQSELGTALGTLRFTNSKAKYDTPYLPATEEITWAERDVDWLIENKDAVLRKWNDLYMRIKY